MKDKNDKLFKGVNYKSEAGYTEVDPASTPVELRPDGKKQPFLTLPQFNFEPDKTYTIVMMGRAKNHQLDAITVEDQFVGFSARK
jgi:hypothetical protein